MHMSGPMPICYLNGTYLPLEQARISPLDRGFLFADSVYEVLPAYGGRMFRCADHLDRLARSLAEIRMMSPHSHTQWLQILEELIERNGGGSMYVYLQVTRGAELGRNHAFPEQASATVFAMAAPLPELTSQIREHGISAITVEDFRWGRCDIKSTALLANVLMKQRAVESGAQEAIIVRDGEVLEGSSTSVFLVVDDVLVTPPNNVRVLPGTTRNAVLEIAQGMLPIEVRRISVGELWRAQEVWISAATRDVLPVVRIDNQPIGSGEPGPHWQQISAGFVELRARLQDTPTL
jgi:D-alanine transaminase